MRSTLRALLFLSLTILLAPPLLRADQPATDQADKLVRAALEAEVQDAGDQRQRLLAEALSADPNHAPASWHSGHVRLNSEWTSLDDVPLRAKEDRRLAAYNKRRDALANTAASHRELARWCAKYRLPDEARVHWAHLLEFDARDAEALRGLGLQQRNGQYISPKQIEREKLAAAEHQRRLREWKPRLDEWQKVFERGDQPAIERVLRELTEIRDPAGVPALIAALALDKGGRHADALRSTIFEALVKIRAPEVTQFFLQLAVDAPPSTTRDAAIEQLQKRPAYAYVPQLLAALPPEITAKGELHVLPGGTVIHEQQVRVEGRDADVTYSYENVVNPTDLRAAAQVTPQVIGRELQKAVAVESQVRAAQEAALQRRARIHEVLTRATEFPSAASAEDWEKQYEQYYGLYSPAQEKQYYTQHARAYEGYYTPPTATVNTTSRRRADVPTVTKPPIFFLSRARPRRSCFAAGTPVATISGPRPVESLRIGDRVLTQDIVTGELTFQPLLETTLRPAIELIEIRCGTSVPVLATPGHPFWVVGQGWQIARLLRPGDRLHGVGGAVTIDDVQVKPPAEGYNLVVSDFHTYFVGDDKLLVHDNAPLTEQPQLIPGL